MYKIVLHKERNAPWYVYRRYSEFFEFDTQIRKQGFSLGYKLPPKLLTTNSKSLEARKVELDKYVNSLAEFGNDFWNHPLTINFFDVPLEPVHRTETKNIPTRYLFFIIGAFAYVRAVLLSPTAPKSSYTARSNRLFGVETEITRKLDNNGVVSHQTQLMQRQDESLDKLSQVIQRQKQMGLQINEELDLQNDLLDELALRTETTDSRVTSARKRLDKLQ